MRHGYPPSPYRRCPVQGSRADRIAGSSLDCGGEIGAPITSVVPSRDYRASVITELSATVTCDRGWHTKSRAGNTFCLQHLSHGTRDYPVPADSSGPRSSQARRAA